MAAFKNQESDGAVSRFKADFVGNEDLYSFGQFFVTRTLMKGILGTIRAELDGNVSISFTPALADVINTFFATLFDTVPIESISLSQVDSFLTFVSQSIGQQSITAIRALFPSGQPTQQDADEVRQAFRSVWDSPGLVAALPFTAAPGTLRMAQAARKFENDRCFDVATNMARKLLKKHKITTLAPNIRLSFGTIPGVVVKEGTRSPGSQTQQVLVYSSQSTLDSVAVRMRSVIDAGGIIQCGVLSGVRQDNNLFKQPEHYLLIFAYCSVDGKEAFLFWDPDAARSDIVSTRWGPGFGCLFHASGRLSTAVDDADLSGIDRASASDKFGDHITAVDTRRHCYQVYWVQTRPQ